MTAEEKVRFEIIARRALVSDSQKDGSINTYNEKRLHLSLKKFCEEDESCHQVPIGPYIADILRGNEIIEVQTGSFAPMREKIRYYLENTDFSVTVIKPIPHIKWCVWIDRKSGDISPRKRSPKKYLPRDYLRDWYYLSEFLGNERLTLKFFLLEEEEYRFTGWSRDKKRGSRCYERVPLSLVDIVSYCSPEDYLEFFPESLPQSFSATEYSVLAKTRGYATYSALKILESLGFIRKGEKEGRSFIYHKN